MTSHSCWWKEDPKILELIGRPKGTTPAEIRKATVCRALSRRATPIARPFLALGGQLEIATIRLSVGAAHQRDQAPSTSGRGTAAPPTPGFVLPATPAAVVHASVATLTHVGIGIVRTRPCLPTRSTMHQRPSRCWTWPTVSAATSDRRSPQPRSTSKSQWCEPARFRFVRSRL